MRKFGGIQKKTMQTLQTGSFLNLENDSIVEALKFTARRLAEHSGSVIAENLNAPSLENLANNLWEKAEYVARETERQRLKQIFVENFTERFRELKPDISATDNSSFEPRILTTETTDSIDKSPAPEIIEPGESVTDENALSSATSKETTTVVQRNSDEFLGFVENEESTAQASTAESETKISNASEETAQNAHETISETLKPENHQAVDETPGAENKIAAQTETSVTKPNDVKPQTAAKSEPSAMSASKNNQPATNVKEPFDFEKCTINLNLSLLPTESGSSRRKAIISAASHDLPPEIDFLEIAEGEDLKQIADTVLEKLARFKQTLPVKYIEQLRASKTTSAKKSKNAKANTVPTQSITNKSDNEKLSGEQNVQEEKNVETKETQSATKANENKTTASSEFVPTANQTVAANEIQQSLF